MNYTKLYMVGISTAHVKILGPPLAITIRIANCLGGQGNGSWRPAAKEIPCLLGG